MFYSPGCFGQLSVASSAITEQDSVEGLNSELTAAF